MAALFDRVPVRERRVVSRDGTTLAYYVIGSGPKTWLMPPAMGAPLIAMREVIRPFLHEYTVVTWDQRGFYHSGVPADADAYSMADHVDDMRAVIRAAGLDRFVLGGWSMGVQLSLEYYHQEPDRVLALVLISGSYERALSSVAPSRGTEALALRALRAAAASSRVLNPLSRAVLGARGASKVLRRVGILSENPEFFSEILAEFCQVDWGRYFTLTRHLHEHSAAAYLPEVDVPTLITSGSRDFMTPVKTAERMHRAIRGSELFVVPGATHYVVAEFPELLADRIGDFLDRAPEAPLVKLRASC